VRRSASFSRVKFQTNGFAISFVVALEVIQGAVEFGGAVEVILAGEVPYSPF